MKKIDTVIRENIERFILEETESLYKMQDLDELFGYMLLRPNKTGLNVDVFVDDGHAYIRDNHIPLVFVRNGYDRSVASFIPVSISTRPQVLDNEIDIQIKQ